VSTTVVATAVSAVAALFVETESAVELETAAVALNTVPLAVPAFTSTPMLKLAEAPETTLASVQTTVPVPPTAGVVQFHPAGTLMLWKVVLAGTGRVKVAPTAVLGPLFLTPTL
jgi:hypothetical protein